MNRLYSVEICTKSAQLMTRQQMAVSTVRRKHATAHCVSSVVVPLFAG